MLEAFIALLGIIGTTLTWWVQKSKNDPLVLKIKQLELDQGELLDKYARSIGRVKTLEKLVIKYKKELYETMDANDLASAWNNGTLVFGDDEDPEDSN